jgi:hypothetical protein
LRCINGLALELDSFDEKGLVANRSVEVRKSE